MSLEIALLHTLLHLSRRRSIAIEDLCDRLRGREPHGQGATAPRHPRDLVRLAPRFALREPHHLEAIVRALRALARQGLVQRTPFGPRLTLAGLAVAVATKQKPRAKRLPGIAMPLVRRRSAA